MQDIQTELLKNIDNYVKEKNVSDFISKDIIEQKKKAFETFKSIGFPNKKMEEWRFTDLEFLNEIPFNIATDSSINDNIINKANIESFSLHDNFENTIVTINGYFIPELSNIPNKGDNDKKVEIMSLKEALLKHPDDIENHFGKYVNIKNDSFSALNTVIVDDGLFIKFPKDYKSKTVFHILHIIDVRKTALMCNNRTLIIAKENTSCKIIESIHNLGDYSGLSNSVTELTSDENSDIEYYKLQNDTASSYYIGATDVNLKNNCNFHSINISLDGKFVKNNLNVNLDGENINANFHGFFFATKDNLIDNHTFVNHSKPNSFSEEVYKGIIDGKSTAVFNGKIYVAPDAQKTNAYQSNKNILLSEDATMHSMPQLEIWADDVKCSHGSTTGYIDDEFLFYLKSRGISERIARAMLLNAFASDIFNKIKISSLCDKVKSLTAKRLNIDENIYFCKL